MERMILSDGPLVQWEDAGWHRGRMLVTGDGEFVMTLGIGVPLDMSDDMLIRHSITGVLEFVEYGKLTIQPEEHPE